MRGTFNSGMTLGEIVQATAPHLSIPPRQGKYHRYTLAWVLAMHVQPEELKRLLTPAEDAPLTDAQRIGLAQLILEQAEAVATKGNAPFGSINLRGRTISLVVYAQAVLIAPAVVAMVREEILDALDRKN